MSPLPQTEGPATESPVAASLQNLVEVQSDPIILLDRDLRVLYANAQARIQFSQIGQTHQASLESLLQGAFPGADVSAAVRQARAYLDSDAPEPSLVVAITAGRETHMRLVALQLSCCTDTAGGNLPALSVSFLKPDEDAYLRRLEYMLDATPDGVFIVTPENRVVYFNRACEQLTGWKRGPVVMEPWQCAPLVARTLADPRSGQAGPLCPAQIFFHCGSESATRELLITTASGREKWVETSYSPVRDGSGGIQYVVGIIRDIDERKRLETQVVQSRNLAMLGQLVSGIAHEIKNPLGIIMSGVEVFLNRNRAEEQREEAAQYVKDEVRRLDQRVKEFLAFARPKPQVPEAVNLNAVLKRVVVSYAPFSAGRVEIVTRLSETAPMVYGDPDQLHQVFLNLILNSDQAMPDGGTVTISTELVEDQVRVRFVDQGPGIDDEVLPRIFDPFFTTKKDGTGLGLSIVHQILTSHKGKINVRNNRGGGVTFEVFLPLEVRAAA